MSRAAQAAKRESPRAGDLKDRAKTVALGLAVYGAVYFAAGFFSAQKTAAAGIGAAIAEWSTGRLGIAWSDPHAPVPSVPAIVKRAARGAIAGLGVALVLLVLALVTHAAKRVNGGVSFAALALGLVLPALFAVRDELLLRGLVLRVLSTSPRAVQLAVCGLASIASALGGSEHGLNAAQLGVAGLSGVAFGALWQRDRGAWVAWGAHAAWLWAVRAIANNFDAASTSWGGGDAGIDGGIVALPVVALAAAAACFWAFRGPRAEEGPAA